MYTKRQYMEDVAANEKAIADNDRRMLELLADPSVNYDELNALHDSHWELEIERRNIESRWTTRKWTSYDWQQYEMVANNID